jgi:hypothetical protein
MKDTFRFDEPGTIARPGPIGRIVRLGLGAACLWFVWQIATGSDTQDLYNPSLWLMAALGLMLAPYVVNIGFGVQWGAWPRAFSIIAILAAAAFGFAGFGTVLSTPLWATIAIWIVYIYGHLGVSFVLSAILGTPGCEMRAVPQLLGIVFRSAAREYYCPGFIGNIDDWERARKGPQQESDSEVQMADDRGSKDMLCNGRWQLLVYGVPFVALQLAGNLGNFAISTTVPALAFLVVGVLCSINAWRVRRVHCFFMGPWCLLVGATMALYSLRITDFGPASWQLIINTGLVGAFIIYITTERFWGKYFGAE